MGVAEVVAACCNKMLRSKLAFLHHVLGRAATR